MKSSKSHWPERHQLTELTIITVTITRVRHILMIRSALLALLISVARAVEQELLGLSQFRDCIQFGRWRLMMMLGNCCFCPRCDCSSGRNYFGLLGFSLAVDVAGEAGGCWVGKTTNTQCSTSCCFTQFRPTKVGNCRIHGPLGRLRAPASFFH